MTVRLDITPDEYHRRDEISSSGMRLFARDGAPDYYAAYIAKTKTFPETDALRLGSATHILFETPGRWEERIQIIPATIERDDIADEINSDFDARNSTAKRIELGDDINSRLPTHRAYMDRLKAEADALQKMWCTEDESRNLVGQLEAILADPVCRSIVEQGGNREQAAINVDAATGLGIRALADVDNPRLLGTDLKTTRWRSRQQFARDALNRGYHRQLAHYESVFDWRDGSGLIAVTNEAPFYALYYRFDREVMADAKEKNGWTLADLQSRYMDRDNPESWRPEGYGITTVIGRDGIDSNRIEWDG